jgi:Mn2+/Fe2+ NRAMP family transporter
MRLWQRAVLFASVLGPGIITANIDNDASGITTYSVAGARYGYALLWSLIPTTVALVVVQEMVARMGVITGKGLSDLIRENFGVRATFFMMLGLFVANFGTTTANMAGWAAAWETVGVSRSLMVPLGAAGVWLLVVRGNYRVVERVLLLACLVYFGYVLSGLMAKPQWPQVLRATLVPTLRLEPQYIMLLVAIIGTTITPWMQFYLQSSIADKGISKEHYKLSRLDVIVGCCITDVVAFFIIVTCATLLYPAGVRIEQASEAALALRPLAGERAGYIFAFSLANASLLGAIIVPLASSYFICEAMGWERGLDKGFRQAPQFMWIYTLMVALAGALVLLPRAPLVNIMVAASVINGVLLPVVLVYALRLVNNVKLMGRYTNPRGYNYIAWATVGLLTFLTVAMVAFTLAGMAKA